MAQRDISRLTLTLLGPPRARLQQAGTLPPHVSVHGSRINAAWQGGNAQGGEGGLGSRLPSAWGAHTPTPTPMIALFR